MGNTAINGGFVELHGETAAPHHLPWPNPQARSFDAPAPMQKRNRSSLSVFHVGNARSKQRFHASSINSGFSIAMFEYQIVTGIFYI